MPLEATTLDKLLRGVLHGERVRFESDVKKAEATAALIPGLPIELSPRQCAGASNAFSHELSYIQGPPGTGKSHTIAAIFLLALLQQKRVLLVSRERAALEVVRNQLKTVLGKDYVLHVGPATDQRQANKTRVDEVLQAASSVMLGSQLKRLRIALENQSEQLNRIGRDQDRNARYLRGYLEKSNRSYLSNEQLIQSRDLYRDRYGVEDIGHEKLQRGTGLTPGATTHAERLADLLYGELPEHGGLSRGKALYVKMALARFGTALGLPWIRKSPTDINRIRALLSLHDTHTATVQHLPPAAFDPESVRLAIQDNASQLKRYSSAQLRAMFELKQLEEGSQCYDDLTNFRRLFHWKKPAIVKGLMAKIDFSRITQCFPWWSAEMRDLGSILPLQPGLFDLVIVDEASQVNIAEIVPAFYRGSSYCVVGDRKQLGLSAAGLFGLNRTYEQLVWNQSFSTVDGIINYDQAADRDLLVTKSSILDFITSEAYHFTIPKTVLNEHYRSMPALAQFTSKQFYAEEGGLSVMTETGSSLNKECFQAIETGGTRALTGKYVEAECDRAVDIVRRLLRGEYFAGGHPLRVLGFHSQRMPSVGIVTFTTDSRNHIQSLVDAQLTQQQIELLGLHVGTPEEFQDNERDVVILVFGLGDGVRYAARHYEDPNRFNVATSRARKFTICIFGRLPPTARLLRHYLRSFGVRVTTGELEAEELKTDENSESRLTWRFSPDNFESEFEGVVAEVLLSYIEKKGPNRLQLFNQVTACGQKRIDFVVLDRETEVAVAIEADGPDHYVTNGREYTQEHIDRANILRRARWTVVHIPYHRWYRNGWLWDRHDSEFETTVVAPLYSSLSTALKAGAR